MSLINDMLNDLEQRKTKEAQSNVDLSWFIDDDLKPNLVEKPQFWVFGILLTAVAVSLFLHFSDPLVAKEREHQVELERSSAALTDRPPVKLALVASKEEKPSPPDASVRPSNGPVESVEIDTEATAEELQETVVEDAQAMTAAVDDVTADLPAPAPSAQVHARSQETAAQPVTAEVKKALPLNLVQQDKKSLLEAQSLLRKGDKLGAERLLRARLEKDQTAIRSAELLASLMLSEERHKAVEVLYMALQLQGVDSADLRTVMGRSYLVTGQPEKAVELLSRSSADVIAFPAYYEVLALAAQRSQRFDLSSRTYQKLLQTDPRRGDWWIGLAIGYDQRENFNAARVAYERALRVSQLSIQLEKYARQRLTELVEAQQLLARE